MYEYFYRKQNIEAKHSNMEYLVGKEAMQNILQNELALKNRKREYGTGANFYEVARRYNISTDQLCEMLLDMGWIDKEPINNELIIVKSEYFQYEHFGKYIQLFFSEYGVSQLWKYVSNICDKIPNAQNYIYEETFRDDRKYKNFNPVLREIKLINNSKFTLQDDNMYFVDEEELEGYMQHIDSIENDNFIDEEEQRFLEELEEREATRVLDKEDIRLKILENEYIEKSNNVLEVSEEKEYKISESQKEQLIINKSMKKELYVNIDGNDKKITFEDFYTKVGKQKESWKIGEKQQVLGLIFNDKVEENMVFQRLKQYEIYPSFSYLQYNEESKVQNVVVVFVLDTVIENMKLSNGINFLLYSLFPEIKRKEIKEYVGGDRIIQLNAYAMYECVSVDKIGKAVYQYLYDTDPKHAIDKLRKIAKETGILLSDNRLDIRRVWLLDNEKSILDNEDIGYSKSQYIKILGNKSEKKLNLFNIKEDTNIKYLYLKNINGLENEFYRIRCFDYEKEKLTIELVKALETKEETNKIRDFKSEDLKKFCRLSRIAFEDIAYLKNNEIYGLISNFINIKDGGMERFRNILNNSNFKSLLDKNWNLEMEQLNAEKIKPYRCEDFCDFANECVHNENILETVKFPKGQIIEKQKNKQYISIEQAREEIRQAINDFENDTDNNNVHLIKAQTGVGKTYQYLQHIKKSEKKYIIACPTHALCQQVYNDAIKEKITDIRCSLKLDLDKIKNKKIKEQIEKYYNLGTYVQCNTYIKQLIKDTKEKIERGKNVDNAEIQDCEYLERYITENEKTYSYNGNIIITHERLLLMKEKDIKDRVVIIDEDIIQSLIRITKVSQKDIEKYILDRNLKIKTKISQKLNEIKKAKYNQVIPISPIGIESQFSTEKEVLNVDEWQSSINTNIFNFINCNAVYKYSIDIENEFNSDDLMCLLKRNLPTAKTIIFSATINYEIYKNYFKNKKIIFHNIEEVRVDSLLQYTQYSFSRIDISQKSKEYSDIIEEYQKKGYKVITFKEFREKYCQLDFINTIEETNVHFGNQEGLNSQENENLLVIGTPHKPPMLYEMFYYAIYNEIIEDSLNNRRIETENFRFWFMTYLNEQLRNIQFWFVESQLEQAIGRARLINDNGNEVVLYSNYPIKNAILIDRN